MRPQTARERAWVAVGAAGLGLVVIFGSMLLPAVGSEGRPAPIVALSPVEEGVRLRGEIAALIGREDWGMALLLVERAERLGLDGGAKELVVWREKARVEMQNRQRYELIKTAVGRGEAAAAMALLSGFPADSVYRGRVEEVVQRLRDLYVAQVLDEARLAQRLGQCEEVRRLGQILREHALPGKDLDRLARRCEGEGQKERVGPRAAAQRADRTGLRNPF